MAIDTKGAAWSEHSTLYALPKALLGGTKMTLFYRARGI